MGSAAGPDGGIQMLAAAAAATEKHKKHRSFIHHHHARSPPPDMSAAVVRPLQPQPLLPVLTPTLPPLPLIGALGDQGNLTSAAATASASAPATSLFPPSTMTAAAEAAASAAAAAAAATGTPPLPQLPAAPVPPSPPPPRTRHRSHQNIVTCDGNWQYHSCPSRFGLAALAAQMLYVASFRAGVSPVPWVVAAEIFPTDVRGAAGGLAASANWSADVVVSALFPVVFKQLGGSAAFGALLLFATVAWLYAWIALPETRGLSPAEVGALMRGTGGGGGVEAGVCGVSGGRGSSRGTHVEVTNSTF